MRRGAQPCERPRRWQRQPRRLPLARLPPPPPHVVRVEAVVAAAGAALASVAVRMRWGRRQPPKLPPAMALHSTQRMRTQRRLRRMLR